MSTTTIVLIIGGVLIICLAAILIYLSFGSSSSITTSQTRNLFHSQRRNTPSRKGKNKEKSSVFETSSKSHTDVKASAALTLQKKLTYAQWKMPPIIYRILVIVISFLAWFVAKYLVGVNIILQGVALTAGPLIMSYAINFFINRRFKAFDNDYPAFLLSLVGLLKTGMNTMSALQAAAKGLEEGSLVRTEVELMVERLRFGVAEDKSIGSFGDDIYHPEIELFVQALLLSKQVGGTLSDTLDRLAKQVRKRQYFRLAAQSAVGMQKGSIWFIVALLVGLEVYLYFIYPAAVVGAWNDPVGKQVWQVAITFILLGLYWVNQVTKIRV